MWRIGALWLLMCSMAAAQLPERPAWAKEANGFGELESSFRDSDLAKLQWRPELAVCSTAKAIFVLDTSTAKLLEFDPRGSQRGAFVVRNFLLTLNPSPAWAGLACDGDFFAYWNQNRVLIFTREELVKDFSVRDAMAFSDLAFAGNRLLAAGVPVVFRTDRRTFATAEHLVMELDLEGSELRRWLKGEEAEGFAAALAQEVLLASDKGSVWVVHQHKRYTVQLFGEDRHQIMVFRGTEELPAEAGPKHLPEGVKKSLTAEGQERAQGLNVPFIARDLVALDGYAWVLLDRNFIKAEKVQVVDAFSPTKDKPLLRIALHPRQDLPFLHLAVTKDSLWLFPGKDGHSEGFQVPPVHVLEAVEAPGPRDTGGGRR